MKNLYQIVDEPKPTAISYLIVPPVILLLVAMFLAPQWAAIWLAVNGVLLGSRTLWKEIGILLLGTVCAAGFIFGYVYLSKFGFLNLDGKASYISIIYRGICYLFLYWAIFLQTGSYELFKYWKTNN